MTSKVLSVLLATVLTLFSADSCGKYDVPAGGDRGDSAGNNQPAPACQVGEVQMVPVAAPEVYNYRLYVEIEDVDCGNLSFRDKMAVERLGVHMRPRIPMVFDDGPSGTIYASSPYQTGGVTEKNRPHDIQLTASAAVTPPMLDAGAAWLTCRIERNGQLVTGIGQVGLARVAITGTGIHTVQCRVLT